MRIVNLLKGAVSSALRWLRATRRREVIAGASVLAVAGLIAGLVVATSSTPPRHVLSAPLSTTTTTAAAPTGPRCPLTDAPAPGVKTVPDRPAVLVKIGNEPDGARPQSGLNEADIVFDTPAEGFVMRYVAVYQCENASEIGPTRSLRWVDWNMIAPQFIHPILAFAGGIDPNVNGLAGESDITEANLLEAAQNAAHRISSRVPPDNLYASSSAIYSLFPSLHDVPSPIFDFATHVPSDFKPASRLSIDFSYDTDVVWIWSASEHQWLHTWSGTPDIDTLTGKQVTTTNVVVEVVHWKMGPYCESNCPGGSGDIESDLLGTGSGYVLRGGRSWKVTWHRPTLASKTTFTDASGNEVPLAPGRTWVEIVPDDAGTPTITP